jgi:hypothetical protein
MMSSGSRRRAVPASGVTHPSRHVVDGEPTVGGAGEGLAVGLAIGLVTLVDGTGEFD